MAYDVQKEIEKLKADISALNSEVYSNNFIGHQDFNKSCSFTTKLQIPHYDSLPQRCERGEIIESGGKLYICSSVNSWALVGTQS